MVDRKKTEESDDVIAIEDDKKSPNPENDDFLLVCSRVLIIYIAFFPGRIDISTCWNSSRVAS